MEQPRIHRDTCTIVGKACLVVFVDEMLVEHTYIFVGSLLTVKFFHSVGYHLTVQVDEVFLGKFAYQRGNVFLLHIGIGVEFAACGGIRGIAVADEKVEFVAGLASLGMLLTVKHIRFCHSKVFLCHKSCFYLVLNLFHTHTVGNMYA